MTGLPVPRAGGGVLTPANTLGSGLNRAAIYDRRGEQRLLDLPAATAVAWGRALGDVSTATVTAPVPSSGAAREACCGDYGRVHTWAHTLVIHRDTERVWEGPIIRKTDRRDNMELLAWDVLGWTRKRRVHTNRVITASPAVTEALLDLTRAFSGDDPNITTYITNPTGGVGKNIARETLVDSAYYWDDLSSLTDMGVHVTTVGRRILVWPNTDQIGQTALLLPDNHLLENIEVIEDGEALATAASARDDKNHAAYVTAAGGAVDSFYGLVESIISSGGGTSTTTALTNQATTYQKAHYPAPVILSVPDGATLRPDSPFPMSTLVPGTTVPVQSTATCTKVDATFLLRAVDVAQSGAGGETVQITLQPLSLEVTT